MQHSLAQLYSQLIQLKKAGEALNSRKCKKRINAITKKAGAFEASLLDLKAIAVYEKEGEDGQIIFLEGPESYFYLDSFFDFDDRGTLVEFGYKPNSSIDDVHEFISDIALNGSYSINTQDSLMLWLANPSKEIRLNGEAFDYDEQAEWIITTNPYGLDWMCDIHDNLSQTADKILRYIEFWSTPRTETGEKIEGFGDIHLVKSNQCVSQHA